MKIYHNNENGFGWGLLWEIIVGNSDMVWGMGFEMDRGWEIGYKK
jgi:hypothetical protein